MIDKYENKELLLNADLTGKKKGQVIKIQVDKVVRRIPIEKKKKSDKQKFEEKTEFIPTERYWRDRLKDAPIDGCVEWAEEVEVTSTKQSKEAAKKPGKSSGAKTE